MLVGSALLLSAALALALLALATRRANALFLGRALVGASLALAAVLTLLLLELLLCLEQRGKGDFGELCEREKR